jgi:hypothetical protein
VTTGQVYHVVAELQGNAVTANGQLLLYTNSVLAAVTNGAGYSYGHTGGAPRVGVGSGAFRHDGIALSNTDFFNGVFDELAIYNVALSPARITAHYQTGLTPPLVATAPVSVSVPVFAGYSIAGSQFNLNWSGTAQLQRATNISGPFITIPGAASPYNEPTTNGQAFFRLIQ